jgi:hypothetical protein
MTCTECDRIRGGVQLALTAVRNTLDDYIGGDPRHVLELEARLHNRMRELKVAVRARHAHTDDHIRAAHRSALSQAT